MQRRFGFNFKYARKQSTYKLKEWLDGNPHKHLREFQEWGLNEIENEQNTIMEAYAAEFQALPELHASAKDYTKPDKIILLYQNNAKFERQYKKKIKIVF